MLQCLFDIVLAGKKGITTTFKSLEMHLLLPYTVIFHCTGVIAGHIMSLTSKLTLTRTQCHKS